MSGDTGMSSELQAIMQRRFAKLKSSEKNNASSNNNNPRRSTDNDTEVGASDGKIIVQNQLENSVAHAEKTPTVFSKSKESKESEYLGRAAQEGDATKRSTEKDSDQPRSNFSDFKRNIARFSNNQNVPANNVNRNLRSPVEARKYSPIPFDEPTNAPHSDSKIASSTSRHFSNSHSSSMVDIKPYALRPSSVKKISSPIPWAGNMHIPKRNVHEQDGFAKAKNANEYNIPKVIVTQPPPPPPPQRKSIVKDGQQKSPSFLDRSMKHVLPPSHVQAMKLKFLLKNPEPQTVASSTIIPVVPLSSSHNHLSKLLKEDDSNDVTRSQDLEEMEENDGQDSEMEVKDDESELLGNSIAAIKKEESASFFAAFDGKDMGHVSDPEIEKNKIEDPTSTFGAIFGQEAMDLDGAANDNLGAGNVEEQTLFGTFDPAFDSEETETKFGAVTSQGAGWNWNADPFSSQTPLELENSVLQIDVVDPGSSKETDIDGDEDEDEAYAPPPSFGFADLGGAAPFIPENDDFEDDDDIETLMEPHEGVAAMSKIIIQSSDVLSFAEGDNYRSFSCQNPVTKNVILCHRRGKTWVIDELDTLFAPAIVCTTKISCADIQRKVDGVIVCGVKGVEGITAGLHYHNGQAKVSIGIMLSLYAFGASEALKMIAVWQWGYDNGRLNGLSAVFPSPSPRFAYDPNTLSSADGLFFIAGEVESKAVILISKPREHEEWIPSFVTIESEGAANPGRIVCMEFCPTGKVVAISVERGAINVWSYSALISPSGKLSDKKQLKLVCILKGASALDRAPRSMLLSIEPDLDEISLEDISVNDAKEETSDNPSELSDGRCHCLAWLSIESSSSPLLLAAMFATGVTVYALLLPSTPTGEKQDIPPLVDISGSITLETSQSASINSNVISPFVASRFDADEVGRESSTVLWMKGGNGSLPYLATILFQNENQMVITVATIHFPGHMEDNKSASLKIISKESVSIPHAKFSKFYGQNVAGSVLAHYHGHLTSYRLASTLGRYRYSELHPKLYLDSMPISSEVIGITSSGFTNQPVNDVLYIQSSVEFSNQMELQLSRRYSLHRANTGDAKGVKREAADVEFPRGGASASFLCDLSCQNSSSVALSPRRIIVDQASQKCIIFFGENNEDTTTSFTCFDVPVEDNQMVKPFNLYPGKDACFMPVQSSEGETQILVLDNEAKILRICGSTTLDADLENNDCIVHIFKVGSSNDQKLLINRTFIISDKIVFMCSRKVDGKQCLFIGGPLESLKARSSKAFVRKKTSKFWLERFELFVSLVQLPSDNNSEPINIAIATTSRVTIVSSDPAMQVLTQTRSKLSCRSLAPLGSNSVAFIDTSNGDNHLTYLTSWEKNQRGIICNMAGSHPNESFAMLALRPDRLIYLPIQSHYFLSTAQIEAEPRDVPLPLTKPLLLFEPLLANALAGELCRRSNDTILRSILERFGPKRTANPYSDNEGLGTMGAGMNAKVFTMLSTVLGPNLKSGEKDKKLAPWVPQHLERTGGDISNAKVMSENFLSEITNNLKEVDGKVAGDAWSNIDETKHAWYVGPFDNREELLLLDSIDEWFGKCRPAILGKLGAELAAETGERALQNILAAAAVGGKKEDVESDDNSIESIAGGWIPNIGEGRKDEDNLSLYLRFSEGSEGESWRDYGIEDLSFHKNKIELLHPDAVSIEETTSNVDEGEPGKVRPLYDIVLNKDEDANEIGFFMAKVPRGGALDVGMFHSASHISRQRATLEFWFFLPHISSEIVLVRKAIFDSGRDYKIQCSADDQSGLLWELVAMPSGYLEFRTRRGVVITSEVTTEKTNCAFGYDPDDSAEMKGQLSFPQENGYGGWNHVSLSFSCRDLAPTQCNVALRMKGSLIDSPDLSIDIPGLEENEMLDFQAIDNALNNTMLNFGLGGINGLRFTEIRLWACKRASDDIKMMMYEHLDIAKTKKKLKMSIRSKGLTNSTKSGLIMPPRLFDKPKGRPILRLPGTALHLVNEDDASQGMDNVSLGDSFADFGSIASANEGDEDDSANNPYIAEYMQRGDGKIQSEDKFEDMEAISNNEAATAIIQPASASFMSSTESSLISTEVRKSAAAAVIRGPPACRHFGGNRGGLPFTYDSSNHGNICITGSEKTVIFSPTKSPRGRTYPIGASGAIISDKIDGTEYLCCFLAKERRIVVFDLSSKVVVVELQMTTKLNYWRYLPPQAHSNTLLFLLVTPMGGFHWMPLEDSPRPKQIWRRGRDLQGKKIVCYEEGGSNGLLGSECKSTIALALASSPSPDNPIEAWCLSVGGGMRPLCVSENVLGAALVNPHTTNILCAFLPLVAIASQRNAWDKEITLALHAINVDRDSETMAIEDVIAEVVISQTINEQFGAPTMAMGTAPAAFCLSCQDFVVVTLRSVGYLAAYKFANKKLDLVHEMKLERYIVDAAIRAQPGLSGIEVVVLACEPNDVRDGRILTINIS